jgi:hypothetical protein
MNNKEKSTVGELKTHVMYIREAIDDIKRSTIQQQKLIDENHNKIESNRSDIKTIKTLGGIALSLIGILVAVLNILF